MKEDVAPFVYISCLHIPPVLVYVRLLVHPLLRRTVKQYLISDETRSLCRKQEKSAVPP